jgi:hypothetical protein
MVGAWHAWLLFCSGNLAHAVAARLSAIKGGKRRRPSGLLRFCCWYERMGVDWLALHTCACNVAGAWQAWLLFCNSSNLVQTATICRVSHSATVSDTVCT